MKLYDFYPKTFHEIPTTENPAFNAKEECIMLVGDTTAQHGGWTLLLRITPSDIETVNRVASVFDHILALRFVTSIIDGHTEPCEGCNEAPANCFGPDDCKRLTKAAK